jgi:bifunctional UDP-N-acetylglucosamine pyrophosphorylase/glucosamine-1-phosphate N-acetyltransferase
MKAIILAAGLGTRMRSSLSKVAHPLLGRPMLLYPVEAAAAAADGGTVLVLGPHNLEMRSLLPDAAVLVQEVPRGTGDAAAMLGNLPGAKTTDWLIIPGDVPCLTGERLAAMAAVHRDRGAAMTVGTTTADDPTGYGRIVRDAAGQVTAIVEEQDASPAQRTIAEVNAGVYVVAGGLLLEALAEVGSGNAKGERYLTDVVGILARRGLSVLPFGFPPDEVMGVNDRAQLAAAASVLRDRKNRRVMLSGVTLTDPPSTWLDWGVEVGEDSVIEPGCLLLGKTVVGGGAVIEAHCRISDSTIGDGVRIKAGSVLEGAVCGDETVVGPMARLRPGTVLARGSRVGNFVEVKKSSIGEESKVSHLTYIGDATIGKRVNVGAGTITCNYDGALKHPTVIEDDVFVGSNTALVAPVTVGRGSIIGAGSTITKNVPPYSLAVARGSQVVKADWARRRRIRLEE